jgi:hypothetical protein
MARAAPRPPSEQPVIRTVRLELDIIMLFGQNWVCRGEAVRKKDMRKRKKWFKKGI